MTEKRDPERGGTRRLLGIVIAGVVAVAGAAGWMVFGVEVGLPVLFVGAFFTLGVIRSGTGGRDEEEDLWPIEQRDERSVLHPGRGASEGYAQAIQRLHNRRPM